MAICAKGSGWRPAWHRARPSVLRAGEKTEPDARRSYAVIAACRNRCTVRNKKL